MLKIFILNINKKKRNNINKIKEKYSDYYASSIREWNNSIYVYNKNALNLIPKVSILTLKLIKSYFNLYNYKLERKLRKNRLLRRLRKLSSSKIYISNGEFKHTNNNVVITLYIYNRQKYNYLRKIQKIYIKPLKKQIININKKFKLIKNNCLQLLNKENKKNLLLIKTLKAHSLEKDNLNYNNLSNYITNFYKKLVKKSLKRLKLYLYYKQLLFINQSKFNYTYLYYLKKYLEKLYNKNVEFNLVNLRRFYLNSDILSESFVLKIRKNRRKLLKGLNNLKRKIKIKEKKNLLEPVFNKTYLKNKFYLNVNLLEKIVLDNIKYKHLTGFRLQAKGRLTRRYTASRSLSKIRYKGNLLNIDSSYKGLSSVLLRGNLRSNLQYTKLKSKTRIGSFGIKGWISGN